MLGLRDLTLDLLHGGKSQGKWQLRGLGLDRGNKVCLLGNLEPRNTLLLVLVLIMELVMLLSILLVRSQEAVLGS